MNRNGHVFLFLLVQLFWMQVAIAQPGDRSFSVVTFDNFGYVECASNNYKFYACSVKYPNSLLRSSSMELIWKPELSTLTILETLKCVENKNDSTGLPYKSYFQASSCLATNVLLVVRNSKDTMLISAGGSDPYTWLLSPNGYELGLPFIFPFQKGLFYLQKLHADKSSVVLFNSVYREYLLAHHNSTANLPNRNSRISYLAMNQQTYHANDTISITLSGRVLNDGACGGGSILWTLQKPGNNKWITVKDYFVQMDCGVGPTIANKLTVPLFIQKDTIDTKIVTAPKQLAIPRGTYRVVVYDDNVAQYPTKEFTVE